MTNTTDIEITGGLKFSATEATITAVSPKGRAFMAHHAGADEQTCSGGRA